MSAPDVLAIIPARFASTRLPGKPLLRETGRFLVQHVVERVRLATSVKRCLVATDDIRIAEAVRSFGGDAVMTRSDHPTGTDRLAEVVSATRDGPGSRDSDVILNVQGDEPEIEPGYLDALVERMAAADAETPMATLACPFPADADPADPAAVKVVLDSAGRALYFSRAMIPHRRGSGAPRSPGLHLHVGVYAYRRAFLLEYSGWPSGMLEGIEQLEQLRVLERGRRIAVAVVPRAAPGIDTPADYARFVERWRGAAESGAQ
ncbi:MAG: 3-deoxy-manno-octulosonate cytidylyltransferase [Planctomycetia bacterium]|nr:MAG: 3-deoxy-manno-octulosonate cytidylyltransferase [Planctomycetia bacterium]